MRIVKLITVLCLSLALLAGLLCTAAGDDPTDLSGQSFTMWDINRNETVGFSGSGRKTMLFFGGIGSCWNCNAYLETLLPIARRLGDAGPQIYLIDIKSNSTKVILAQLGDKPLPGNVYVGSRDTFSDQSVYHLVFSYLSGSGSGSLMMPLVVFADENGMIVNGSTGYRTEKEIVADLAPFAGVKPSDLETVRRSGKEVYAVPGTKLASIEPLFDGDMFFSSDGPGIAEPELAYTGLTVNPEGQTAFPVVVMGDVDCDGLLSAADARLALRASVGLEPELTPVQRLACFVDGLRGDITAAHARLILRGSVGLEDPFGWLPG